MQEIRKKKKLGDASTIDVSKAIKALARLELKRKKRVTCTSTQKNCHYCLYIYFSLGAQQIKEHKDGGDEKNMCACLVLAVVVEKMKRIRNPGIKGRDWV